LQVRNTPLLLHDATLLSEVCHVLHLVCRIQGPAVQLGVVQVVRSMLEGDVRVPDPVSWGTSPSGPIFSMLQVGCWCFFGWCFCYY
jgi:hypothetical protein